MPSATFADSRLSIAASTATAKPAETSARTSVNEVCGSAGSGSEPGRAPMRATSRSRASATTVAATTARSDAGPRSAHAHHDDHHEHDEQDDADGGQAARVPRRAQPERVAQRAHRDRSGVLAVRLGDAQRRGHLLQEDDHGDADREAFDDGPRDVGEIATDAGERGREDEHACEEAHHQHGVRAVARDDRDEHHGHRAGRPRHLHARSTEHGGDDAGDDRGDESRLRTQTGRDPEREREGQRDDADGEPGNEIVLDVRGKPA